MKMSYFYTVSGGPCTQEGYHVTFNHPSSLGQLSTMKPHANCEPSVTDMVDPLAGQAAKSTVR